MGDDAYRILPGTNPFVVHTPEDMPADEVVALFVDVMAEITNVTDPGHAMLHGPRGSGKSMIFRFLRPDCQMLKHQRKFNELPFLGLYVGVKRSDLGLTELRRVSGSAPDYYLLEHLMVMHVLYSLIDELRTHKLSLDTLSSDRALTNTYNEFINRVMGQGDKYNQNVGDQLLDVTGFLDNMHSITDSLCRDANTFIRRMSDTSGAVYDGPLCGYTDVLLPFFHNLKKIGLLPDRPVYLLVDDADELSRAQTQVLNSWIHMRTSLKLSIKATTQYRYKTFRTPSGASIDAPHDFRELDTAHLYTVAGGRSGGRYRNLVIDIVQKRFDRAGVETTPHDYFPPDEQQEAKIRKLEEQYKERWATSGRGARPSDDASRYARPDFIRDTLKGTAKGGKGSAKSGSTYSYAGLDQLINVSDGVYRFLLDPASKMYDRQRERNQGAPVTHIDPSIQNAKVREEAEQLQFTSFDKLKLDEQHDMGGVARVRHLQNLVMTLGEVFHLILISNRSERRVFSIALSQQPDDYILDVLHYGVATGYFAPSTIGNKEGTGRTRLYVLTRRLAPVFLLDPNSFAGYLFVTNDFLSHAMNDPKAAVRQFETRLQRASDDAQLTLFEEGEE